MNVMYLRQVFNIQAPVDAKLNAGSKKYQLLTNKPIASVLFIFFNYFGNPPHENEYKSTFIDGK